MEALACRHMQQAGLLAKLTLWQTVDRIIVSSEPKTLLTVALVQAQHNLPVTVDTRFDELHRPGWVEDYATQTRYAFAEPTQSIGVWEPAATALARFQAGVADLCIQFAGATLALVGHGLTLSLYRAHLLGYPAVRFEDWQRLGFAAVALVDPVADQLLQDFQPVVG